ncbi:MAG TPA: hypothetical protein PKE26_04095 [Kiritimatiellia bacterium]|nr:hypothetical protein [Kiritimatiellia bacterium]HMO98269.1 hypothetical protein [Kiritimatiellia bacterium]HMP96266.1 hypothetical protein [Kiritimatiellia bacterium]
MAKKRDNGVSLDSFLDILTCLQGVLMLIIITTGIDAAQTKVMVATPIELAGNERPIYIEARNNQLFTVPLEDARRAVAAKQLEVVRARRAAGDASDVMEAIGSADIDLGTYVVDFTRFLSGQIALMPKDDVMGYSFEVAERENENTWFGRIVAEMDRENERLNFLVRDDSFEIFKLARFVAWTKNIKVTYSLIPRNEPLIFSAN